MPVEAMDADQLDELELWYRDTARTFLEEHGPERLPSLDAEFSRLTTLRKASANPLPVCFLGNSGVGKSTMLNAMVAGALPILPAGGIGPLTAQATLVAHSHERYFRATYLPASRLNNVLFGLERHYQAELERQGQAVESLIGESALPKGDAQADEEFFDAEDGNGRPESASSEQEAAKSERVNSYIKQACLLVLGRQFTEFDLPYLLDSLRECLGRQRTSKTIARPEDAVRVHRIREALATPVEPGGVAVLERRAGHNLPEFLADLRDHAAGFLAPLIKTLEVGWDAPFLQNGLTLVDLPGLGVANDEYRRVTTHWIRTARAVVLVVDRSGVTESSADLLRTTGFLTSLLHEGDEPDAEEVQLMVAVVKLDLTADDSRNFERTLLPETSRKWIAHFDEACERAIDLVRGQMERELYKVAAAGGESTRIERDQVVARILSTLKVFPLAATEYRKLLADDDDARPRIRDARESRIPQFVDALEALSLEREHRLAARLQETASSGLKRVLVAVELVVTQWEQDQRANPEAERLRKDLDEFAEPLKNEFLHRQGSFREFLRNTVPQQIELRVENAALAAQSDLQRELNRYRKVHWATLRAAIRRGGAFVGSRHIDLPNEITLLFEEPVAIVWAKHILASLRKETAAVGADYLKMVGEIAIWARSQGTRVDTKLVEALYEDLKAETSDLGTIGKEAIDELKASVKTELYDKVEHQVRRACEQFVKRGQDVGVGVKARMLELLGEELAPRVVEVARPAAVSVLSKNYKRVGDEITVVLSRRRNPVETAVQEIVGSHETRVRRSDAQKRRRVLEQATEVLARAPARRETERPAQAR